jgi:hypothetical protein
MIYKNLNLFVVVYGCEAWSLALGGEYRFRLWYFGS